jgi:hypothetical protein
VRVVACFLVVFLLCLAKLALYYIVRASVFTCRRLVSLFVRRVVVPCILSALLASVSLTCGAYLSIRRLECYELI